jgi:hypothetical protein
MCKILWELNKATFFRAVALILVSANIFLCWIVGSCKARKQIIKAYYMGTRGTDLDVWRVEKKKIICEIWIGRKGRGEK